MAESDEPPLPSTQPQEPWWTKDGRSFASDVTVTNLEGEVLRTEEAQNSHLDFRPNVTRRSLQAKYPKDQFKGTKRG